MADASLNANQAVTVWHESAQRPGFKALLVQIVCNLTGGPQQYTGRPMDEAHKYMNITPTEWDKFMEIFNGVCASFNMPDEVVGDLNALLISMEDDCVCQPGEQPPPPPGPRRLVGNSLYARLGGIYPVALFVDRLVDALMADDRVHIPQDHKRTDAALKYLVTELVCSVAGGPEVRTSPDFDEAKLLIPKSEWQILITTAGVAADHFSPQLRLELVQLLQRSRTGIVDPNSPDMVTVADTRPAAVKSRHDSAAGQGLAEAARERRQMGVGASVASRLAVFGDPRTLYGRGGGVFGLAKLTHRLMDVWMANPTLNANTLVAKWHESQQSCGFKFLVTQLMGYLAGGPQRYTGQSMLAAHKHLGITPAQWDSFIVDAQNVFQECRLDSSVQRELMSVLQGLMGQCVTQPGEQVAQDAGLCRRRPAGSTPYAHLGGVYPIALFVDRLVQAVVAGNVVQVDWDPIDSPGCRHAPGLKYMLTELLCWGLGGPEQVTCKGFEEAKLGIKPEQWDDFKALAAKVSEVWPTQRHRDFITCVLEEHKVHICIGLVEEENQARRALAAAGFGVIPQAAALDRCNGDAIQALALLRSGWTPEQDGGIRPVNSSSSLGEASFGEAPICPFMAHSRPTVTSAAGAQKCPFMGGSRPRGGASSEVEAMPGAVSSEVEAMPRASVAPAPASTGGLDELSEAIHVLAECGSSEKDISSLLKMSEEAVRRVLAHDRYATAARVLAKRKVPLDMIVDKLQMSEARVHAALQNKSASGGREVMHGRILGNVMQERLDELLQEDASLCCPVTLCVFQDPVIASDGFMYEQESLTALIRNHQDSPMTRERLQPNCFPAKQKRSEVMTFREERSNKLLLFAEAAMRDQPAMALPALERVMEYLEVLGPRLSDRLLARTAELWSKTGHPVPEKLRAFLGTTMSPQQTLQDALTGMMGLRPQQAPEANRITMALQSAPQRRNWMSMMGLPSL
jgi:truncated hemoglobin YjbI